LQQSAKLKSDLQGTVCLGIPAITLYVIAGKATPPRDASVLLLNSANCGMRSAAAVLHVLQALLFLCVGKARGFFSWGSCMHCMVKISN
jgi:hypothetical protein